MGKMYDEYHEYRVDTQRWTKWPKALIMTHEWSTNGHDRRLEQRRYVPDDYAVQVERKNYSLQGLVNLYQQEARRALDDEHQTRSNVNRLRDRVHEIAADRDRIKAQNAKLQDLIFDMLVDEERGNTEEDTYYEHVRLAKDLGIEVES